MSKNRKPPRKPTGQIRHRELSFTPGKKPELTPVMTFKLPEEKNAAESVVMGKLFSHVGRAVFLPRIHSFEKFPTDHGPDFKLTLAEGPAFAELTEIALLTGPYATALRVRNTGDYIDHVVALVKEKERIYREADFKPIYLVIYVSDEVFSPDVPTTMALRKAINSMPPSCFEGIFLVLFAHKGDSTIVKIRPEVETLTRNEARSIRRKQMVFPDLSQAKIVHDASVGNQIDTTVRVYMPKGTDMTPYRKMIKPKKEY
jgi:hypothetical protein